MNPHRRLVMLALAATAALACSDINTPIYFQGETFEALYWVEGKDVAGERRWWVARSGSRIWSGGTAQRPAEIH